MCWGFSACLPAPTRSHCWAQRVLHKWESDWESDGAAAGGGAVGGHAPSGAGRGCLPGCRALAELPPLRPAQECAQTDSKLPASLPLGGASCTHTQFGE